MFAFPLSENTDASTAPPLLVHILRGFLLLGWDVEYAGVIMNIFLGSLLVPVGFLIMLELSGGNFRLATGIAWLLAIHPALGDFSHLILRETPYLFAMACAIGCALFAVNHHSPIWCGGAGCWTAVSILFRWEALEMLPLFSGAWTLAMLMFRERRRELFYCLCCFIIGLLSVLLLLTNIGGGWSEYKQLLYRRLARLLADLT